MWACTHRHITSTYFYTERYVDYLHEIDKVLERSIQVSFLAQRCNLLEMRVIDVRVHAEQALEDVLHDRLEGLGERHAYNVKTNELYFVYLRMLLVIQNTNVEANLYRSSMEIWSRRRAALVPMS